MLDRMAARGQIVSFTSNGVQHYALAPFVIGIYEFQLNHLDQEFADLFEEYAPHLLRTVGGHKPALGRVVPINASIETRLQILGYEDMRAIIREAKSFALRECICRKERALQGHPCTHSVETCLAFSPEEGAFDYFNYAGRVISSPQPVSLGRRFRLCAPRSTARDGLTRRQHRFNPHSAAPVQRFSPIHF